MPRKLRLFKARLDAAPIRPSVLHYLTTGELDAAERDNPWLYFSLTTTHARAARQAWADGDEIGARAHLSLCPAADQLFTRGA